MWYNICMAKIYTYQGNYYTHLYHIFTIEIEAESPEEANAKAEAYLRDKTNHEELITDAETNHDRFWMSTHKSYFEDNAEIDFCQDEEGDEIEIGEIAL